MFFSQHQWWVMESRVPLQAGGEWYLADWRAMGPIPCFHGWSTVYSPLKGEQLKGDPTLISLSLHHTDPGKSWGFCWPSSKNLNFWVISIQDNVLGIHSTKIPRARFPLSLIKAQRHYASTPHPPVRMGLDQRSDCCYKFQLVPIAIITESCSATCTRRTKLFVGVVSSSCKIWTWGGGHW